MAATHLPAAPLTLHRTAISGHCHRVELLLSCSACRIGWWR